MLPERIACLLLPCYMLACTCAYACAYLRASVLTSPPPPHLGDGALLPGPQPHLGPHVLAHEVVVEVVRVGLGRVEVRGRAWA